MSVPQIQRHHYYRSIRTQLSDALDAGDSQAIRALMSDPCISRQDITDEICYAIADRNSLAIRELLQYPGLSRRDANDALRMMAVADGCRSASSSVEEVEEEGFDYCEIAWLGRRERLNTLVQLKKKEYDENLCWESPVPRWLQQQQLQ